jgi:hypothetical protein
VAEETMSNRAMVAGIHPVERRESGGAGTSHPRHPALAADTASASTGASSPRGRSTRQRMRRAFWRHFGRYLEPRPVTTTSIARRSTSHPVA